MDEELCTVDVAKFLKEFLAIRSTLETCLVYKNIAEVNTVLGHESVTAVFWRRVNAARTSHVER